MYAPAVNADGHQGISKTDQDNRKELRKPKRVTRERVRRLCVRVACWGRHYVGLPAQAVAVGATTWVGDDFILPVGTLCRPNFARPERARRVQET